MASGKGAVSPSSLVPMTGLSSVMSVRRTSGVAHGPVGPEEVLVIVLTVLAVPPVPFMPLVVPLEPESLVFVVELPWDELPWEEAVDWVAVEDEVALPRVALPLVVVLAAAPFVVPVVGEPLEDVESSGELQASATPPKSASTRPVTRLACWSSSKNCIR